MAINRSITRVCISLTFVVMVKGMFFTDSKENDYPRIGKRCDSSSNLYNSVVCRYHTSGMGFVRGRGPIALSPNFLATLPDTDGASSIEYDSADSTENIFKPVDVKPYRKTLSKGLMERLHQYLRATERFELE